MDNILFKCSACKGKLRVDVRGAGRIINCPLCSHTVRVPALPTNYDSSDFAPKKTKKFLKRIKEIVRKTDSSTSTAIISALVTALIVLNSFSGIVGGLWLAIKGQWTTIIGGILLSILMPLLYAIANLPTLPIVFLIAHQAEKGNKVTTAILGFLVSMYSNALIAIWAWKIFVFMMDRAQPNTTIPYLLWSQEIIMAPLGYMLHKESSEDEASLLGALFGQLCFVILAMLWFFNTNTIVVYRALLCLMTIFSIHAVTISIISMSTKGAVSN